jgi:hypothetical protein
MRPVLALAMSVLLSLSAAGVTPDPTVVAFAKREKPGKTVVIKLIDKEKVKGTLVAATDTAVEISFFKAGEEVRRAIPYEQIESIGKPAPGWAWVALGVVAGAVALMMVGYAHAG